MVKVVELQELAEKIRGLKDRGKKIVHCHGIFDILHIGHIRYLEQAKQMGDVLVVTIRADRFASKGDRPAEFDERARSEMVASLRFVDYVSISGLSAAADVIRLLKPHIYVKGAEFKTRPGNAADAEEEGKALLEVGAVLAYTAGESSFRTSRMINTYLAQFSDEVKEYMRVFRQRWSKEQVLGIMENMSRLKVLVIGDTILDEYQYCEAIGKSSKDPVLALKYQSHDLFAGGVLAVANHVANFAGSVQLATVIGEKDSHEEFLRSQLNPAIDVHFVVQDNAPTLIKRRFIEGYSLNKLFEVYVMDGSGLSNAKNDQLRRWLEKCMPQYDVVIAADFGHGAINDELVETLVTHSPFLAVNTQANAGNRGFHTVSRYAKADFACIAEHEIRLETRTLNGDLKPLMDGLARKLKCREFVVTRGRHGALVRDAVGDFIQVPSFARNVVDRVGAGDAFFAVTAMAASQSVPSEIIGFIGNAVGSLAVEIVGNKKSIDKRSTRKFISDLFR